MGTEIQKATNVGGTYKKMTIPLKKVVDALHDQFMKINNVGAMTYYDMGVAVRNILQKRETGDLAYGDKPIEQMAEYFRMSTTTLYQAQQIAMTFKREFVLTKTKEAASRNFALTYNHWMQLSRITDPQRRSELLANCIAGAWSYPTLALEAKAGDAEVTEHHRAGGRKPGVPADPIVALIRFTKDANKLRKYGDAAEDVISQGLLGIPPGELKKSTLTNINDALESIEEIQSTINTYAATLRDIYGKLTKATKVDPDEEEDDDDVIDHVPAKKPEKTGSKKTSKNKKKAGRR